MDGLCDVWNMIHEEMDEGGRWMRLGDEESEIVDGGSDSPRDEELDERKERGRSAVRDVLYSHVDGRSCASDVGIEFIHQHLDAFHLMVGACSTKRCQSY